MRHTLNVIFIFTTAIILLNRERGYAANEVTDAGSYYTQAGLLQVAAPQQAQDLLTQGIRVAQQQNDAYNDFRCSALLAEIKYNDGNYQESLSNCFHALKVGADKYDTLLAPVNSRVASIYKLLGQYEIALMYSNEAVALALRTHDSNDLAGAYNVAGNIYLKKNNFDTAWAYYNKALALYNKSVNWSGMATEYNNLAGISNARSHYDEAIVYYLQALDLDEHVNGANSDFYYNNLGAVYREQQKYTRALDMEQKALGIALKQEDNFSLVNIYYELSLTSAALNDFKSAFNYQAKYIELSEHSFNEASLKKMAEMQNAYDNQQKQAQIELLQKDSELQQKEITSQKLTSKIVIAGLVLIAAFAVILLHINRRHRKTNKLLEQKNMEIEKQKDEIKHYSHELESSNQVKNKLFSVVSHDLRAPLATLEQLLDESINQTVTKEELLEYLKIILDEVKGSSDLLHNLLHWAKSQMNGIKPALTYCDLKHVIAETTKPLDPFLKEKEIAFYSRTEEDIAVKADKEMLKVVIRNLVSNAIKFSSAGDKISVRARGGNDWCEIKISDTGVGIPPDVLPKLFQLSFYTTSGTREEQGTGLGLLLCKDFIEAMGGHIWVESKLGKGTSFFVTLPMKKKDNGHEAPAHQLKQLPSLN